MLRCKKKKRKKELKEECVHQEALPCPAAGTQPPVSLWPSGGPCLLSESDDFLIARGLLSGLFEMALPHGPCSALSALSLDAKVPR